MRQLAICIDLIASLIHCCAGGRCTLTVFVQLIKAVLPVCDQEAAAIYDDWAGRDGNTASLSQADVDILWGLGGGNADGSGISNSLVRLIEYALPACMHGSESLQYTRPICYTYKSIGTPTK